MRLIVIFLVTLLLLGCQSQPSSQPAAQLSKPKAQAAKTYQLRGVVIEVHKAQRILKVKHDQIPGYMRAMTMDFPVRDEAALDALAPGDQITAELNVAAPGDYWLANIRKTSR
jgi:protein SCO1/2